MVSRVSVFDLPVFGPADVFPMMGDDELQELAADIRENGLNEPLVVGELADADGELSEVLIDGRNRRAACRIAGVEPAVRRLTGGEDATAYVLSANIHRRHMTKGQRAMAVAMIYPEGSQGRKTSFATNDVSGTGVRKGRLVLSFAPDLVPNVLSGSTSLDEAYKAAQQRKEAASSAEARIAALRARYPELADRVVEGELTIAGARHARQCSFRSRGIVDLR